MTDYISREAALEAAKKSHLYFGIKPIINSIPAADVRPVVRGKWMWLGDCSNEGLYCSVCKNKIHETRTPKKKLSNFCPNCGADMREES